MGAYKINNAVVMALLAKEIGKTKLIAETVIWRHDVTIATTATFFTD